MDRSFLTKNLWMYYVAFWVVLFAIQFALSFGVYNQEIGVSAVDSLFSNFVFAIFGVGLWFMIRFSGNQKSGIFKNLAYYLAGCAATVLLWQASTYLILTFFFETNLIFLDYYYSSLIVRVIMGVMIYFLLISLDFLILSFEEMQEHSEHEANLSAMLREAELNMLRSQIRPHFLFNSLNSVSALTLTNPKAAQDMIIKLSEFMRHSLNLGADAMSSLGDELYNAGLYLDIEKVRFSDRLIVEKEISDYCERLTLPAMILQPLLENAVKHGVNTMLTSCTIKLKAGCDDNFLKISISNDFDPDAIPRKGTGTGLKNVQKRMATIYGRNDLVNFHATDNVFEIMIIIPVSRQVQK